MSFDEYVADLRTRTIVGLKCELCGKRAYHVAGCVGIASAKTTETK